MQTEILCIMVKHNQVIISDLLMFLNKSQPVPQM